MKLIILALAPVFIIALYVYFHDKYEKEPLGMLIKALIIGAFAVIPILIVEGFLQSIYFERETLLDAAYRAFIVAGASEEFFKFLGVYLLIWNSKYFNEKFDGIVYAVFVSLGFAAVENLMYVINGGTQVAYARFITAVPAHAIFGILMGYYLGIAHMYKELRPRFLNYAFLIPFLLHGFYDFILMSGLPYLWIVFTGFVIYLYVLAFKRMKVISDSSIFREEWEMQQIKLKKEK
jgi:RsiW-degrading membrane proteinase PrsW (M82 family)